MNLCPVVAKSLEVLEAVPTANAEVCLHYFVSSTERLSEPYLKTILEVHRKMNVRSNSFDKHDCKFRINHVLTIRFSFWLDKVQAFICSREAYVTNSLVKLLIETHKCHINVLLHASGCKKCFLPTVQTKSCSVKILKNNLWLLRRFKTPSKIVNTQSRCLLLRILWK